MTGPANGGTERDTRAPSRPTGTQGAIGALLVVLVVGLVLRLILARLLPGSGFEVDLGAFRYWASNLAERGPVRLLRAATSSTTTRPATCTCCGSSGSSATPSVASGDLIKIPPILSDLAVGYLAWSMVRELGGRDRLALAAAAVAVLNPDHLVRQRRVGPGRLVRRRLPPARIARAVARPARAGGDLHGHRRRHQAAAGILIPLVAVVTIRRALWPAGGFGDAERTGRPVRIPDHAASPAS